MDQLPLEVLHIICEDISQSFPRGLRGLSTVNKSLYHAALPFLYQRFRLQFGNKESLDLVINNVLNHPWSPNVLNYTRRLDVICLGGPSPPSRIRQPLAYKTYGLGPFQETDLTYDETAEDMLRRVSLLEKPQWDSLVSLISKLRSLTEFNYSMLNVFPRCLLEAIHQRHPLCKLNIHTFFLPSLLKPQMNPDELELICSPCLHSVQSTGCYKYADGMKNSHAEHFYRVMSTAPNLKHLQFRERGLDSSDVQLAASDVPRPHTKGPPVETLRQGSLESLSFSSTGMLIQGKLRNWSHQTDFSKLRALNVGNVTIPELARSIAQYSFARLEKLSLTIDPAMECDGLEESVEEMLGVLNPLKNLRITGYLHPESLRRVIVRHGPTLQGLGLMPPGLSRTRSQGRLTHKDIVSIAQHCPSLTELRLYLQRSHGDQRETQFYQALGQFPRLQTLALELNLDFNHSRQGRNAPLHRELSSFEKRCYKKSLTSNFQVQSGIINSSICEDLALAVWETIALSQSSRRLRTLEICCMKGIGMHTRVGLGMGRGKATNPKALVHSLEELPRSYFITRNEPDRYGSPAAFEIVEQSLPYPKCLQPRHADTAEHGFRSLQRLDRAFELIWPSQPEHRHWRPFWMDFPLQKTVQARLSREGRWLTEEGFQR